MGRVLDEITPELASFIAAQHVFFVATAPTSLVAAAPRRLLRRRSAKPPPPPGDGGHVNLSPKGLDTFAVLGPREVAYLDLTDSPHATDLVARFPEHPGARSVVRVDVDRVSTSCGYGVPVLEYRGERSQLLEWATRKGPDGLVDYRADKNAASIDGLPAWSDLRH